MINIMTVSKGI